MRASQLWPSGLAVLALAGCGDGGEDEPRPASSPPTTTAASGSTRAPGLEPPRSGETYGAKVTGPIALRAEPSDGARRVARHGRRTEFDSPTILAVLEIRGRWLGVLSEKLDNGELGWVRADRVKLLRELWSIDADISERRAVLRRRGRPVETFPVAVGAPETATPPGTYGVTDRLTTGGPGSPYGCCVLALSGRQPDVPQDWPGGDRLAIHGTTAPSSIGTAASNGCLRASEETMRLLIRRVPIGTQVHIRP